MQNISSMNNTIECTMENTVGLQDIFNDEAMPPMRKYITTNNRNKAA